MLILPAIDLINGKCVRLTRGDYSQIKEYSANPLKIAKTFKKNGAKMIHVVDLEGAKKGRIINLDAIKKLLTVGIPIQIGGGIRNYESAEILLNLGVSRLILGTAAIYNPNLIKRLITNFGANRILISIDIKNGEIATNGWRETSNVLVKEILETLKKLGIKTIIITDINQDGMLNGINLNSLQQFIDQKFNLIIAGGITNIDDIKNLKSLKIAGAIIGKALYEGTIDLKQALSC